MELRGRSHWHFIQAIEGGNVIKLMNVDTKGRPEIKYKTVKNVYDTEDVEVQNPVPVIHLRDDLGVSPSKSVRVKIETIDQLDEDEKGADLDDPSFSSITLKEFMDRYKTKKRKSLTGLYNCEESTKSCSSVKQFQEDDCDLEVPLSILKAKLFKKVKRKKKCSVKCVPNSQNPLCIIKYEEKYVAENFCQTNDDWLAPLDVKVEACEVDYSDSQAMSFAAADSNFNWREQVDSCLFTDNEVPVSLYPTIEAHPYGDNKDSYEYMEDIHRNSVRGFPCWDIIKVNSPEAIDVQFEDPIDSVEDINEEGYAIIPLSNDMSSCSMSPIVDHRSDMDHISLISPSNHDPQTCTWSQAEGPQMTNSILYLTETCDTCVDQSPLEYRDSLVRGLDDGASTWQIVKIDEPEKGHSQCLDPCRYKEGGYIKSQVPDDVILESSTTTLDHISSMGDCLERNASEPSTSLDTTLDRQVEVPATLTENDSERLQNTVQANSPDDRSSNSCAGDSSDCTLPGMAVPQCPNPHSSQYTVLAGAESPIEVCDMAIDHDSQILESSDQSFTCSVEDSKNDRISEPAYNSVLPSGNSYASCIRESCSIPARKSSISEENKLPSVRFDDAEKGCYVAAETHDTTDETILSGKLGDPIHSKLQHPPERLFSNRKVISPPSQRKLCQAMESPELDENDQPGFREKFYIVHSNHRILKAEGMNHLKLARSTTNTKQILRKPKHDQTGNRAESFSKVSHHGSSLSNAEAGWHSIQNCSRSAITFSQQQMKDIQSVASKLTKELNSMKEIVKQMWEASATTSFKQQYITQVRTAFENATRVEETSKQRLMHMKRNCIRFCKVMELAEDSFPSENASDVNSKKRKISFADESGGKLCHVMVIKDDMISLETRSVGQELLAD